MHALAMGEGMGGDIRAPTTKAPRMAPPVRQCVVESCPQHTQCGVVSGHCNPCSPCSRREAGHANARRQALYGAIDNVSGEGGSLWQIGPPWAFAVW